MTSSKEPAAEAVPAEEQKATKNRTAAPKKARVASAKNKPGKVAGATKSAAKAPKKAKARKADGAREGSKASAVLALLQRANGATLAELMEATGWQAHSVRGFLSGVLGKRMGLKIESAKREDGTRAYGISQ